MRRRRRRRQVLSSMVSQNHLLAMVVATNLGLGIYTNYYDDAGRADHLHLAG